MKVAKSNGLSQSVIWTVGHSNRPVQELLTLLHNADIQTVIDCRSKPKSRWPQFNSAQLALSLVHEHIRYEPRGKNIGGFGGNVQFDETLDELTERAKSGERLALLCSEGKPQDCHRGTILTPELEKRGVKIEHLLYGATARPAQAKLGL